MDDLRSILTGIYQEHRRLTPQLLVAIARDETHPLHGRFVWDDSTAAEKFREIQAADLIRSVKVTYKTDAEGEEYKVRAFPSVPRPDGSRAYMPNDELAHADEFTQQLALRDMERRWKRLFREYRHMQEFVEMVHSDIGQETS